MEHINQIDGWAVAKLAWGCVMSLVAFLGARKLNQLDKLQETAATTSEVQKKFESLEASMERTRQELREDMREHREESRETLGRIFQRIDKIADRSGGR
jgi:DNA anti-recombination protein RmuC